MSKQLTVGVIVSVTSDTDISCDVDTLNDDVTFTLVGADGLESYLTLDEGAMERLQRMIDSALREIRTAVHDDD